MVAISHAKKPGRPDPNVTDLPDWMWEMMERCWDSESQIEINARRQSDYGMIGVFG